MSIASPDLPNLATVTTASASSGSSTQATSASASASASVSATASVSSASSAANSNTQSATGANSLPNLGSSSASSVSSASAPTVITSAPTLTSGLSISQLTGLPTLSGFYSYPAPTVPPTANAPYMQSTSLPSNFVFIIVGAVIAFFALCIIAWRSLSAWSINRNIKRDGVTGGYAPLHDTKKKQQPFKTESSHDMADLSALPKSFGNTVPSLFFSPTAEAARQSMVRPQSHSHNQHMPSGHYRDASR